jgi:hypothetical protein
VYCSVGAPGADRMQQYISADRMLRGCRKPSKLGRSPEIRRCCCKNAQDAVVTDQWLSCRIVKDFEGE